MRPRLPDSYVPDIYMSTLVNNAPQLGGGTWPTANKAIYVPVIFPFPCQLYSISFVAVNGTGNYDLGFYDGYAKNKIQSTGSTAMTAAGAKTLTFTQDYRVDPGKLYYAALALSSTSGQVERNTAAVVALISIGLGEQTSALPLPSSAVPVTVTSAVCPLFVFGIR